MTFLRRAKSLKVRKIEGLMPDNQEFMFDFSKN